MDRTNEYLNEIQRAYKLPSDYKLAQLLGVRPNRISNYRHGRARFEDSLCVEIARCLNICPGEVLAAIHSDRSNDEKVAKAWDEAWKILKKERKNRRAAQPNANA